MDLDIAGRMLFSGLGSVLLIAGGAMLWGLGGGILMAGAACFGLAAYRL